MPSEFFPFAPVFRKIPHFLNDTKIIIWTDFVVSRPGFAREHSCLRVQKKAMVRVSILSRPGASAGVLGSVKAVCAVKRDRPSFSES